MGYHVGLLFVGPATAPHVILTKRPGAGSKKVCNWSLDHCAIFSQTDDGEHVVDAAALLFFNVYCYYLCDDRRPMF